MKTSIQFSLFIMAIMMSPLLVTSQKMQEKDVPVSVKTALQKQYPKAAKVKWNKESDKYEAEFDLNKEETSVLIDASGNVIETEVEIEISKLPKGVAEYVKTNYKSSIKEAAKITDAKGSITYEAEIKGKDIIFDSNGKFIKETKD